MTSITNQQVCICIRNGVEIWVDANKQQAIRQVYQQARGKTMVTIEGRDVNLADLVGIFRPEDMEAKSRRSRGEWVCDSGHWHTKHDKCAHADAEALEKQRSLREKYSCVDCNRNPCECKLKLPT